jgi:hypothetical protein
LEEEKEEPVPLDHHLKVHLVLNLIQIPDPVPPEQWGLVLVLPLEE